MMDIYIYSINQVEVKITINGYHYKLPVCAGIGTDLSYLISLVEDRTAHFYILLCLMVTTREQRSTNLL